MTQPHSHPKEEPDVHMMMGAALVAGFVVMLLIDQLWKHNHSHLQHGAGGEWHSSQYYIPAERHIQLIAQGGICPNGSGHPTMCTPRMLKNLGSELLGRYMHLLASPLDFRWRDYCAQAKEAHSHYWPAGTRGW